MAVVFFIMIVLNETVIKTHIYGEKKFKKYELDHNDNFRDFFIITISSEILLKKYLRLTNKKVISEEIYCSQSGWIGRTFVIDEKDLSINGYCFNEKRLLEFLIENKI